MGESGTRSEAGFEYLDHPADIQIHSWASDYQGALCQAITGLFGYMTDLTKVEEMYEMNWTASGRGLDTLLFAALDEALHSFQAEPFFVARMVEVTRFDRNSHEVEFRGWGDSFDISKHPQEADIKAITYSNMQIIETADHCDLYVIVDI